MENTTDFNAHAAMGKLAPPRGNQQAVTQFTSRPQFGVVVMGIAQDIADFKGQLADEQGGRLVVGGVGGGQFSGQWNPDRCDGTSQMKFPAVRPKMISATLFFLAAALIYIFLKPNKKLVVNDNV